MRDVSPPKKAATRPIIESLVTPRFDAVRHVLAVDDIAWCLVTEHPTGDKGRATLAGAAQVAVQRIEGDDHVVVVVQGSGVLVGRELRMSREQLFARDCRVEHAAFAAEVTRFWGRDGAKK